MSDTHCELSFNHPMFKLYGIPNCDTVKKARMFLEKKKIDYEFFDFKKTPPTEADVLRWEKTFGDLPVNSKGTTFKKFKAEYEKSSRVGKLKLILANPSMIKRPILQKGNHTLALGFVESEWVLLLQGKS